MSPLYRFPNLYKIVWWISKSVLVYINFFVTYNMLVRHFHRRNLPHLYYNEGVYFITYCLKNRIYPDKLKLINLSNNEISGYNQFKNSFIKYDSLLNKSCSRIRCLEIPEIMEVCRSSLQYYNKTEIDLFCYCIMPDHIHLVFELLSTTKNVGDIMGSIKQYSARKSNKILGKQGQFWQPESYDRLVRDDVELYFIIKYVLLNPVKAGLVSHWRDWKGTYCAPAYEVID